MKRLIVVTLVLASVFASLAVAQTKTPKVNRRQERQEKRIREGQQSGELTKKESAKLKAQQERIERKEDQAKADGKVTKKERKKLDRMQDNASKKISNQKSDVQKK